MKKYLSLLYLLFVLLQTTNAQTKIITGAERIDVYAPMLKGKAVAVFANHTSVVGNTHLVDTLVKRGIKILKIFGPEHGFRGNADAGEKIGNYKDEKTGIPVISLYGTKRRPSDSDLKDVDIMVFDIQDVGVRFYTYISSLEEYMIAAFENSKPLLVLDRPNPNGFYVDGPVLDPKFKSFVGMQPVPIVYGLTIGEYAMMIAGEKWLSEKANKKHDYYRKAQNSKDTPFHFLVIKCQNYDHKSKYILPIKPSPNIPEIQTTYWYPSTCFFEGTALNEGRGTPKPFQYFGHPSLPKTLFSYTPRSMEGAKNPKLKDTLCYGWNLSGSPEEVLQKVNGRIHLNWLINAYKLFPDKARFFTRVNSFNRLAGTDILMQQVIKGMPEEEIKKSWEPALSNYKKIRKKYLLYTDF
jgi:uncharacterized protein YbbC (DUF1343 family)